MSISRAAPTLSSIDAGLNRNANSSNSSRYGRPPIVIGFVFCGIVVVCQLSRLISLTCGFGRRAWISLTFSSAMPPSIAFVS